MSTVVPHFGDRLAEAVARRESQVVLGLDPDPARLWPAAREAADALAQDLDSTTGALADRADEPTGLHAVVSPSDLAAAAIARAERESAGVRDLAAAVESAEGRPDPTDATSRGAVASRAIAEWRAQTVAGAAVGAHCRTLIDAAGSACVAVKPQLACFERLGQAGVTALQETIRHAREAGLLVLLDGKRGDVPVSAAAYGQALAGVTPSPWGELHGLGADGFTANPLLGRDALEPLVETGAGVFVLVRTSNPGAADVLDLETADGPLWEHLARLVAGLGTAGPVSGLQAVGAVTGATAPEHLERMRELMPHTPFLLPGVGAQGGDVATLGAAFAPGPAGGLVTASRSIADAHEVTGGDPADAALREAERLRAVAWGLAGR